HYSREVEFAIFLMHNSNKVRSKWGGNMEQLDKPIYTVHQGRNSGLIKSVAELYFNEGDKIADVTYGKGAFWREIDLSKYDVVGTDLKTGTDFRKLPYEDNLFNHSVIDPPYARITNLKGIG
ncbi:hypothetical protein, partial [Clostridium sp. C2-6-12]|uniref:hypothetical protein n=1 Tax=Clostridium sp. C2-6-12 TaxID=2698832 RepID=UPI001FAE38DD